MGVGKTTFTFSNDIITVDGDSTNINLTRDNQSYTNKLLHGYGNIYTFPSGVTDYVWSPTAAQLTKFFEEVPSQKTRLIDVYLDTYNGSTRVGRDTHALTVTLTEDTGKPTISDFSITDSNPITSSWGVILVGKSNVTASVTASGKYGATIASTVYDNTTKFNKGGYSNIGTVFDNIADYTSGDTGPGCLIACKVTDSRGFSSIETITGVQVLRYVSPRFKSFTVTRCDTSGNASDTGTKAKLDIGYFTRSVVKVNGVNKNTVTVSIGYKKISDTNYIYTDFTSTSSGGIDLPEMLDVTLDADEEYLFSFKITDMFESYVENGIGFSNYDNIMYVSSDGKHLLFNAETIAFGGKDSATIEMCGDKGVISVGKPDTLWGNEDSLVIEANDIAIKGSSSSIGSTATGTNSSTWAFCGTSAGSVSSGVSMYAVKSTDYSVTTKSTIDISPTRIAINDDINYASGNQVTVKGDVTANYHGIENLMWMYCVSTTGSTETLAKNWNAINYRTMITGTGLSYEYFTMGDNGLITFNKAGLYRLKLNVHGWSNGEGRIGCGIFNGSAEEYSSFTWSNGYVNATCEALLSVAANETRTLKCGGWPLSSSVATWYLRTGKGFTNLLVQYLGPA